MRDTHDADERRASPVPGLARLLALGLALGVGAQLPAQTVQDSQGATPSGGQTENIITLDAFEVSSDRDLGYTAASAMAGGRIDTPLKNTPAAVSIMTQEFMEDVAINNFVDAAQWAPNAVPIGETNNFGDFNVNVRGIGSSYPTRNYFRWYMSSDAYNTERLEFARGPNSILFGDGNPGGISTTWTKQAMFKERSSVQMRLDSYGGYRLTGDYNLPVNEKLAFRLNAVHDRIEGWRDGDKPRRDGGHIAVTYRLSDRTQIRAEFERGLQRRYVFSQNYRNQSSNWDTVTSYNGVTPPPTAGTGVARLNATAANDYLVYSNVTGGLMNWRGFFQSSGNNLVMTPEGRDFNRFPDLPSREYSVQPDDGFIDANYRTWSVYLEQQVTSKMIAQLAYNYQYQMRTGLNTIWQDRRIDVNTALPDGSPNPNYGKAFSDATPTRQRQGNQLDDWRLSLVYRDKWKWLSESLSFMSGYRTDNYSQRQWRPGRTNGAAGVSPFNAANIVVVRQYWDEPKTPGLLDDLGGNGIDVAWINNAYAEENQSIQYNQLASMSSFFDNRLSLVLGYRYDFYNREQQRKVAENPDGTPIVGATDGPGTVDTSKFEVDTKSAGLVYFPVPWIGFFGNYSESFNAAGNGAPKIDGTLLPLASNEGIDVGVKMEFFDGKVSGSLSYYETEQTDRARTGDDRTEINNIWAAMGLTEREIPNFRDTDSYRATGYELDVTANLTRNWRLMLNYSLPKTEQVDIGAGLRGYYAANIDEWRAAANNPNLPEAATVAANAAVIERTIQGYEEGRTINNTFDYIANIYTTYSFRDGHLKGFAVGGGANFRGQSVIGNSAASAFDYLHSDSYQVYTAHLSYERRFGDVRARFQLNVANLLDNDSLRYLSYARTGGIDYPNTFGYIPPRRYTVSASFNF